MTKESNDPMIETLIDLKIFQTRRLKDWAFETSKDWTIERS
jgi:hypothetical protein